MHHIKAGLAALSSLCGVALAAPIESFLVPGVSYDDDIETPDEHFRHGLGDKPVRHDQLVSYLTGLSEVSDRITHEEIGRTHEGRPILFFTITSAENHERIEEIRTRHLARLNGESDAEAGEDDPAIIWINYGVHGAESAGMDAAIPTLYHFAAAEGEEVEEQLDDAVILVVAILNPDGHARRIDHVETFSSVVPVTDPAHAQHNLWTAARTNHYWFDLNRQWLPVSQPEARAWVSTWQSWKPQVSADFHEMGSNSTYYFHPGEPKRKNPLIPDEAREIAKDIAENHRGYLDEAGLLYFTEQGFDNFYIGKGSTYPQVNGGIGILFEVGAARGGEIESPSGGRSYADNIRTHFRTTLTTIEGTLEDKDQIAAYQQSFFENAQAEASRADGIGYVVTAGGDRETMRRFLDILAVHDVEVRRLADDVELEGTAFSVEESYVVPFDQPQYRFVKAIFDRVTEFEENIFYDVSGWTLPLAYDLDYALIPGRRGDSSLMGRTVDGDQDDSTLPLPRGEAYGYIVDWQDRLAPRALYRLLDEDILVRIASEPFEVRTGDGIRNFEAGSVFIPADRQETDAEIIRSVIEGIVEDENVMVTAVTSGAGDDATASLGGASFRPVEKPQILLLFDDGLARYDAGEVWHLLDHEMEIPVTLRRKDQLGGLDWSRYTHLVMVGGYGVALPENATDRVRQWIREEGGTLIALRQSALWAQETFLDTEVDASEPVTLGEQRPERLPYEEMRSRDAEHVIGGAIVATDLDLSHPLGFGYQDRMVPVLRNHTQTLAWPKANPYAVVAAYPEEGVLLSGYVSERRIGEIADTPALLAQRYGNGAVVLMADNPVFRGMFLGTNKLFLNAIFFSDLIDNPSGDYTAEGEE
jgi:hypothetical protein